ncbi:hypothetical protein [Streptomyces chrestomyceticus]|uniref:hypothetical protein n=1 Tax=Streptomyces chrestomyceticus TaxID=68185 RepID=UPI0033E7F3A3
MTDTTAERIEAFIEQLRIPSGTDTEVDLERDFNPGSRAGIATKKTNTCVVAPGGVGEVVRTRREVDEREDDAVPDDPLVRRWCGRTQEPLR